MISNMKVFDNIKDFHKQPILSFINTTLEMESHVVYFKYEKADKHSVYAKNKVNSNIDIGDLEIFDLIDCDSIFDEASIKHVLVSI
ncbi:MAG: hypothetical protein N2B06_17535 [Clostridium sp.]